MGICRDLTQLVGLKFGRANLVIQKQLLDQHATCRAMKRVSGN